MVQDSDYLSSLPPWSAERAHQLALEEGMRIEENHMEILMAARDFFSAYGFSPSMRPLCKVVTEHLGVEKGRSLYLNKLFSGSPAKLVAKLAGLPKPKNCI
jgi:tRNA 2-thiouridine synthesizing protein E